MTRSGQGWIAALLPLALAALTDCSSSASNKRAQEPAEGGTVNASGGTSTSGGTNGGRSGGASGGVGQSGSAGVGAPAQGGASTGGLASAGTSDTAGETGSGGSGGESTPAGTGGAEGGSTSEPQGGVPAGGSDAMGGEAGASGGALCSAEDPLQVSEAAGRSQGARVVWTGDGYGAFWQDDRDGDAEIYFARLDSEGAKMGDDVRITDAPGLSASPSVLWASSEFALTWYDDRDGNTEIYFARVGPSGTKLGGDVRVTTDEARSEFPSLAPADGGYAVAWNDDRDGAFQIYVALLDGAGAKPAPEQRVSGDTTLAASPSLARGPGGFGVAWHDLRDGAGLQIYFAGLDEDGARIGDDFLLSLLEVGGGTPSVASTGSSYAVAWADGSGAGEVSWISVGANLGVEGEPLTLSDSQGTATFPVVLARSGGYAIAWPDGRDGDREIYVQELDELGGKVGQEVRASDDATASLGPTLTASVTGYGVAWLDDPSETTGEVHFTRICR